MKKSAISLLPLLSILLASCGGGASDSGLQQADVDLITSSLADALGGANPSQVSGVAGAQAAQALVVPRADALTTNAVVNHVTACPVDGHVTTAGNVYVSCPTPPATGACTLSGAVTISFGDRTNNLNDCTYTGGLVVDGTLHLSMSGSSSGATMNATESLVGSLGLYRKGPTGGLVPIDLDGLSACYILLTANLPARTITGSVCGQSVNRTF